MVVAKIDPKNNPNRFLHCDYSDTANTKDIDTVLTLWKRKLQHKVSTRISGKLLKIPKVKLEFARSGFFFMGARIFNSLPMEVRASLADDFRNKVKTHFLDK